nr:VP2 [Porcine polyomavirus]QID98804.1 VP2 [Porcine polyomavirus]
MGIVLAIPEIIAAAVEGAAEAIEIAGSFGAVASGEGLTALETLVQSATLGGEELGATLAEQAAAIGVTDSTFTLLSQTPELVNTFTAVGGLVNAGAGLAGGIATYLGNPGGVPGEQSTQGGGGSGLFPQYPGHGGAFHPTVQPSKHHTMDLAVLPPYDLETGIPGIPDWILNLLPELPSLPDLISRIANGIWTSYYHAGTEIMRRTASEELQRLMGDLSEGLRQASAAAQQYIRESDPVNAIVRQIERAQAQRRIEAARLIQDAERGVVNVGELVQRVGDATRDAAGSMGQILSDIGQLPVDGYNALSSGVQRLGQWIAMPGPSGGTMHYSFPSWVLYVLDELEIDFTPKQAWKRKREPEDKDPLEGEEPRHGIQERKTRRHIYRTGPKTTHPNKKRRR